MPVNQMCRLLSSCVAGSLVLAACSNPEAPGETNGATAEAVNTVNIAEVTMNEAVAPENKAAPVTNSSAPEALKEPVEVPAQPATEAKTPAPVAHVAQPPQFATCLACHSVEQGAAGKIGPNLFGVVGSKAGSKADYSYSDAMKNSGITWTPDELSAFLLAPQTKVPGTKMTMKGPSDERIRQTMIDYLATLK